MLPRWDVAFRCDHVSLSIMSDALESAPNSPHDRVAPKPPENGTLLEVKYPLLTTRYSSVDTHAAIVAVFLSTASG